MNASSVVVGAFTLTPFRPHPLVRGGHLQTILGAYWPQTIRLHRAEPRLMKLADGDTLVLHDDVPEGWKLGDPVVLLLHGLGGSHRSAYVVRTADKLNAIGIRTFRMDLRGCGEGYRLAKRPVHAGRSDDASAAVDCIRKMCPSSPIIAVGYSMGGNMVLKMAGEMGDHPPAPLLGIAAVAPPADLEACSRSLQLGFNRFYDRHYLARCLQAVATKRREVPEASYRNPEPRPRSLRDFDDVFTSRVCGFRDVADYYEQASSARVASQIQIPTLIVSAEDDPIVPAESLRRLAASPLIELHITPSGGHLGFLGRRGIDPDRHWLDWRIVEWVRHLLARDVSP